MDALRYVVWVRQKIDETGKGSLSLSWHSFCLPSSWTEVIVYKNVYQTWKWILSRWDTTPLEDRNNPGRAGTSGGIITVPVGCGFFFYNNRVYFTFPSCLSSSNSPVPIAWMRWGWLSLDVLHFLSWPCCSSWGLLSCASRWLGQVAPRKDHLWPHQGLHICVFPKMRVILNIIPCWFDLDSPNIYVSYWLWWPANNCG